MKYKINQIIDNLKILDTSYKITQSGNRKMYLIQCQLCKNDSELYGDATYLIPSDYFKIGKKPCGCSSNTKYTKQQWVVLIKRKAKENNHEFVDFISNTSNINQDTKLNLNCLDCGNNWKSCSINNYIKNRGCPFCANLVRAIKKSTCDDTWISRFLETGKFDGYEFTRITKTGRLWNVICPKCGPDKIFVSDRSNLSSGKIPCDCNVGGGFDKTKDSYIYVLVMQIDNETFCGYGITNFPNRRIVDHQRTLKSLSGSILNAFCFSGKGVDILNAENYIKNNFDKISRRITGFITESASIKDMECILNFIKQKNFSTFSLKKFPVI